MKTLINAYKSDYEDQITIIQYLAHFKKACKSNGVSGGMNVWIITTFLKKGPASSLTGQITLYKNDETTFRLAKTSKKQISTNVET